MNDEQRNQDDPIPEPTVADALADAGGDGDPGHPAVDAPAVSAGEALSRGADVVDPPP